MRFHRRPDIALLTSGSGGMQVSSVDCGYFHCLAVTRDGKVLAWGKGDCGQLGTGDMSGSLVPKVIQSLCTERVKQVACGSAHSIAVTEDGIVYAWGYGSDGQLGLGKEALQADVPRPTQIQGLPSGQAMEVACGSRHSLCVLTNGSLFSWGLCDDGRLGLPPEFTDAQAHAVEPALVPLSGESVKSCAAGGHHSLICTVKGRVMSCGRGTDFQLGHGDDENQRMFKTVGGLRHVSICVVACGDNHSAALTTAQEVYMWGSGEDGQLGHGVEESKSLPTLVRGIGPVSAISLGKLHSVAVRQNVGSSIDRIAELEDKVRDLSSLLQSAKSSMQEERRMRLMAERRLHESEQRMSKMERANSLKQRGVEAVTELATLSHKTKSVSCESVGVQTEQIANISSTQMLLDLRRPALSLNGKARSQREEKEIASNIEAEARRRGDVLRRAAAIHAAPAANGAAARPSGGIDAEVGGGCRVGGSTAVVVSGEENRDEVFSERKHRHEAFIDAFGGQREMDRIQSAAIFANDEDVDSILERELSEEDGSMENASIGSSRSLPHPEDNHALGDNGGSSQSSVVGSNAVSRVSAPPDDKKEAARLAALQFVRCVTASIPFLLESRVCPEIQTSCLFSCV